MKKIIFAIIFAGLFLAQGVFATEKIDNFEVSIEINSDASLDISEKIEYNFGTAQKHGIFREIPLKYKRGGINYNLRISNISVTDERNQKYKTAISRPSKKIQIKIGDKDKLVTGKKIYIINYKIRRALNYFDDHDELYWNATGSEWPVAIERARTIVSLPNGVKTENLQTACFFGPFGSTTKCNAIPETVYDTKDNTAKKVIFEQGLLAPGQGLTVVVGFPKGIVAKPTIFQSILYTTIDNWVLLMPLIVFIVMFTLWFRRGRDPKGRGTIIPQYEPPQNLTPAEMGTIIDERVNPSDITAEIIYLAIKGYLKIACHEKEAWFKPKDYELQKLKEPADLSNDFDKKLMESLFGAASTIKLSSLKNKFSKDLQEITNQIYESTARKNYFPKNPNKVRKVYSVIGVVFLSLTFFAAIIFNKSGTLNVLGIFSAIISGLIIILFSLSMPAKTKQGVLAKEHILGLKSYLSVAEKDRLTFHNAPEKKPEHFEALLPFAMVLGVEKEWAKQFEGIYNQPPTWYVGPVGRPFNSSVLASDLGNFRSTANASLGYRASAASGGSGFGGGFSGGGFGGGGGGSW